MPTKLYRYIVRGSGAFPKDMLRYDCASVIYGNIDYARDSDEYLKSKQIELVSKYPPTRGRWESFGWHIVREVIDRV